MARPRIIGSLMRTAMPPRSAFATPTPMNQVPSVAMKEGILSRTWIDAVDEADRRADDQHQPRRRGGRSRWRSRRSAPASRASPRPSVRMPSTERSIEPIRMMKVAPMPSTSGIIAAWLIRTELPSDRKFGLIAAMMTQSATSTASGAQARKRRQRRARMRLPAAELLRRVGICLDRHRRNLPPSAPHRSGRAASGRAPVARVSCTGSARWRGPRCRPSRAAAPP